MSKNAAYISVITPCLNAGQFIEDAVTSVVRQGYANVEHIVCDGGSSDGSLDILSGYAHLRVYSRRDRGIYDGMNRGLAAARGDVIIILNADDRLEPGALESACRIFGGDDAPDMLTGATRVVGGDGARNQIVHTPTGNPDYYGIAFGVPAINARFFSRALLKRVGLFDLRYPYAADREWLFRVVGAKPKFSHTDKVIYTYRAHPGSASLAGSRQTGGKLWRDHLNLTKTLLESQSLDRELEKVCRMWRAVEGTKLLLRGWHGDDDLKRAAVLADLARVDPVYPARLPAGLLAWFRRRGRHSDRKRSV